MNCLPRDIPFIQGKQCGGNVRKATSGKLVSTNGRRVIRIARNAGARKRLTNTNEHWRYYRGSRYGLRKAVRSGDNQLSSGAKTHEERVSQCGGNRQNLFGAYRARRNCECLGDGNSEYCGWVGDIVCPVNGYS